MFGPWVWGDVRASWKGVVDTIKVQTYKSRPRLQGKWDFAKENNWRQSLEGVNLPSIPENDTLVSIVMPAWNRADLITRAVRSVQRQTLQEWELIVVDDGSTDSTCDVVRLLAMADKRIKLVEAPHGGVCAARNIGLNRAVGHWVSFLDTDNLWPSDYLELSIRGAIACGHRAVYAALELHNGTEVKYRAYQGGVDDLMIINHIDLNVLTVEREQIGRASCRERVF